MPIRTDGTSTHWRGRSTPQFDEDAMIGEMRERLAVLETTIEQTLPRVGAFESRQQALGGRVYALEATTSQVPVMAERVSTIERRLDTAEQRQTDRALSKTHRKEQRQDALKALSLLVAAGTMALWAVGKIPEDVARPVLSALGLGR